MAGRRGGRGNVGERKRNTRRDEEFELMYGEGTQGPMTGIEPLLPWNTNANRRNAIATYNKYHLDEGTTPISLDSIYGAGTDKTAIEGGLAETHGNRMKRLGATLSDYSGMLSGTWDKLKGVGESLFTNNEYKQEFEDTWLKRLGYEGMPRLEMYKGEDAEAEFDRDWREYWDTHPDNLSKY